MPEYGDMEDKALEEAMQAKQAEIAAAQAELQGMADERDSRFVEGRAKQLLEGLTPGEKDALIRAASAEMATKPLEAEAKHEDGEGN